MRAGEKRFRHVQPIEFSSSFFCCCLFVCLFLYTAYIATDFPRANKEQRNKQFEQQEKEIKIDHYQIRLYGICMARIQIVYNFTMKLYKCCHFTH